MKATTKVSDHELRVTEADESHCPLSPGYDQKARDRQESAKMIAIMGATACTEMPMLRMPRIRLNSADIRHDPNRRKTAEDLKRIEAARLKRERKAARRKKFNSHNSQVCNDGRADSNEEA